MLVDRRGRGGGEGKRLVIVCEGNAGFYECGYFESMVETQSTSCLGWNRPGFCCSTGRPTGLSDAQVGSKVDVMVELFPCHAK